jgi:serine/threonine protein kinase
MKMAKHPNIVRLMDVFEDAENFYLVLEYMGGGDLFDYLKSRNFKLSENQTQEIIYQLALAIEFLHSFGIVHRDIKLENVMMSDTTDSSVPKLADFGLAKIVGPSEKADEPFGTLGYAAPEVLRKEPYGPACDLWSLGCICYALLCGALPFDHESQRETAKLTLQGRLTFDQPTWNLVSDTGKDFIKMLVCRDTNTRYTATQALNHPWLSQRLV